MNRLICRKYARILLALAAFVRWMKASPFRKSEEKRTGLRLPVRFLYRPDWPPGRQAALLAYIHALWYDEGSKTAV